MPAALTVRMDKALDGARILWRWFLAAEDREATEGHVREFTADGEWVRIAASVYEDDSGRWLRCADIRVHAVLEEKAETKKPKRRRPREDGEGWKDGDGFNFDS